ncbi:hypothetical protein BC567DRAFT_56569 [Phyllosticta citribraziliensis]
MRQHECFSLTMPHGTRPRPPWVVNVEANATWDTACFCGLSASGQMQTVEARDEMERGGGFPGNGDEPEMHNAAVHVASSSIVRFHEERVEAARGTLELMEEALMEEIKMKFEVRGAMDATGCIKTRQAVVVRAPPVRGMSWQWLFFGMGLSATRAAEQNHRALRWRWAWHVITWLYSAAGSPSGRTTSITCAGWLYLTRTEHVTLVLAAFWPWQLRFWTCGDGWGKH